MCRGLRQWVREVPHAARRVLGADFVSNVGNGMALPFLAIYVARIQGAGLGVGSAAVSLFAAGCIVANLAAGRAVDRWGARRSWRRAGSADAACWCHDLPDSCDHLHIQVPGGSPWARHRGARLYIVCDNSSPHHGLVHLSSEPEIAQTRPNRRVLFEAMGHRPGDVSP